MLSTNFQRLTHPDDLDIDLRALHQMLAQRIESYQMEKRYIHKDGRTVWIQLNVSPVWNPDGTPRNFVTQIQDIGRRKQTEIALRENRAKLMLAMDMSRLAHWEYDVATARFIGDENIFHLYGTTTEREGGTSMPAEEYIRRFVNPVHHAMVANEIGRAVAAEDPATRVNSRNELSGRTGRPG